jgi:hypothetical protein
MHKKLYLVRITRLVLAATDVEAKQLACNAANRGDVECAKVIDGLYDLPVGWENAVPYGATQDSAYKILVAQLASDARFDAFEVHACMTVGEDEQGVTLLEQCDDSQASLWSVYGHLIAGGLECLGDFNTRAKAGIFLADLEQAAIASEIQMPEQCLDRLDNRAEDAHLESLYEERVSGGNYEEF